MAYNRGQTRGRDMDGTPPARTNNNNRRALSRRDYERMNTFNESRNTDTGDQWERIAEPGTKLQASEPKWRQNQRKNPKQKGPGKPAEKIPGRSTTQTEPQDEDLYTGEVLGAVPVRHTVCQNYDFASFSTVLRATYDHSRTLESRLDQMCPFPVFQHSMAVLLNARIMSIQRNDLAHPSLTNKQDALEAIRAKDMLIPKPIFEYLNSIGQTLTPTGDKVFLNLPSVSIPQGPIEDTCSSGTFGQITAENHNVYEANWSPYVTKGFINATLHFNQEGGAANWIPLPEAWIPEGGVANENLLGWQPTLLPTSNDGKQNVTRR